jgi:probable O-glycosylation ligase (exosortase A-associated)
VNAPGFLRDNSDRYSRAYLASLFYLFIEYARPQEKYDVVRDLPLGKAAAFVFLVVFILEGKGLKFSNRLNGLIVAFTIWLLITTVTGVNPGHSFEEFQEVIKFFFFYFLTINIIDNKKQLYVYILSLLILYLYHTNFSVRVWVANGFHAPFRGIYVGSGFLHNPNDFGAALCAFWGMSLFMMFGDTRMLTRKIPMKWFHLGNTITFLIAVLASSSRGAALGLAASAMYAVSLTRRKFLWFGIMGVCGFLFVVLLAPEQLERFTTMGTEEDSSAQERLETWYAALLVLADYPLFGVGLDNFIQIGVRYARVEQLFVQHNIYLEVATETGVPGLILVLLMIWAFMKNQWDVKRLIREANYSDPFLINMCHGLNVSMAGFLCAGFFITVMFYPFFWVNLTISTVLLKVTRAEIRRLESRETRSETKAAAGAASAAPARAAVRAGA